MHRPDSGSTQRILIVDDSPPARLMIETALRAQGYGCLATVESAHGAFRALGLEPEAGAAPPEFDLILMDLLMPEVDGLEACRRIKSFDRFTDVPLIMVTAEDSAECLKAAFDAGAMDYLKKPVNPVELAARVQSALRLKQETDCRKARERALEELSQKLRRLSNVDGLTELANRRHFDTELERVWRRSQREGGPIALVMIDVDHFKSYNDHYGHLAGDECLRRVAEALRKTVKRPFDLVARYGGEEFAVLLPDTSAPGAEMLAEEMRASVEALDIPHSPSKAGRITISGGVGVASQVAGLDTAGLVAMADRRLYEAKHAGRNRVMGVGECTPARAAVGVGMIRVLAVEDSPVNLLLIKSYLKDPRFQLEIASNGAIAVEKFQSGKYDIVLMDVQMPVMDGYTATRAMRAWEAEQHTPPTPILALTAHAFAGQEQESLAAGCNAHLVKPVSKTGLHEAIQAFASRERLGTAHAPTLERILVNAPPGIEEVVPIFLEMAREDLQNLEQALRKADYARIRLIGHDLKGSGGGYGFDAISTIGKLLEDAAKRCDSEQAGRQIVALTEYLERVEVV